VHPLAHRAPRRVQTPLALVLALLGAAGSAGAQSARPAPYSTLTVRAGATDAIRSGRLATYWTTRPGAALEIRMPFHAGAIGASVQAVPFSARSGATGAQPDFQSYLIGLDWQFERRLGGWLVPSLTLRAGDFLTVFEGVTTYGAGKESEIFVGGSAGLAIPLARGVHVAVAISGAQVLTATPIRLTYATVGVERAFATPRWMRRVLE